MAAPMRHVGILLKRSLSCHHFRCNEQYRQNQLISFLRIVPSDTFSTQSESNEYENCFKTDPKDDIEFDKSIPLKSDLKKTYDKELFNKYSLSKRAVVRETSYGTIRYDGQSPETNQHHSKTKPHDVGNPSNRSRDRTRPNKPSEDNYFDEQYFSEHLSTHQSARYIRKTNTSNNEKRTKSLYQNRSPSYRVQEVSYDKRQSSMNYVDDQYFPTIIDEQTTSSQTSDTNEEDLWFEQQKDKTHLDSNVVDEQYFGSPQTKTLEDQTKHSVSNEVNSDNIFEQQYFGGSDERKVNNTHVFNQSRKRSMTNQSERWQHSDGDNVRQHHDQGPNRRRIQKNMSTSVAKNVEKGTREPVTAYDVALELRKKAKDTEIVGHETEQEAPRRYSGTVDSKGYRILKNQVPDIMNTPSAMVVNELWKSIIYDKDDIIAIYKPYGLPSHGGPHVHMSVGQLLPALAHLLDPSGQLDTLHLVHRLDRQTTGVMLLAKTAQMAWQLNGAFRRREVVKKYWVLTKGIPRPDIGIIDIPLAEGTVEKYYRMVLKPEMTDDMRLVSKKSSVDSRKALTKYEVVASYGNAALVECTPETGLKHQIRVHLAFGLNTPILGDHKYSHLTKMAPQRLDPDTLHLLGIRQSKVRHLPMMLHAKSLLLPEFKEGKNVFISCPLPPHFTVNMKRLKIKTSR